MKITRLLSLCLLCYAQSIWATTEVRLAVHDSFDLPKELISRFEKQHDAKVSVIKAGDGNELLNRLITARPSRLPMQYMVWTTAICIKPSKAVFWRKGNLLLPTHWLNCPACWRLITASLP